MSAWKIRKSDELIKTKFFRARVDECELPDGRIMPRYYTFEYPDWVNIVAITKDMQVVLLKQYRHSAGQVFLEIPGGSTLPNTNESTRFAAERELLEETGYQGVHWMECGFHYPNPAVQNNRLHTYLALGCEKVAEPNLDPFEDLETVLYPAKQIVSLLEDGEFSNCLIAASVAISLSKLRALNII